MQFSIINLFVAAVLATGVMAKHDGGKCLKNQSENPDSPPIYDKPSTRAACEEYVKKTGKDTCPECVFIDLTNGSSFCKSEDINIEEKTWKELCKAQGSNNVELL